MPQALVELVPSIPMNPARQRRVGVKLERYWPNCLIAEHAREQQEALTVSFSELPVEPCELIRIPTLLSTSPLCVLRVRTE